ncbi:hypothetical protein [Paracidobacterium acidisoli]|uniref:Uncharacterized protein n=1 Tax=Paracidobacterium acidisoli TaxID=2303751 RepID=A0A372IT90_9BACT|nr:hypothetical protein [Paracidobacterium acidisoli]MBT9329541.1 hypothetical protein [Paracidobacterium acidisoli]
MKMTLKIKQYDRISFVECPLFMARATGEERSFSLGTTCAIVISGVTSEGHKNASVLLSRALGCSYNRRGKVHTMPISAWKRAGLSFGCCLLLVVLMSGLLGPRGSIDVVYRVALLFVLPLWLVLLPVAIKVRDAKGIRFLGIMGWGTLAGPVALLILLLLQILHDGNFSRVWQGDPTVPSTAVWIGIAAVCSLFVSVIYGVSLKAWGHLARQATAEVE